MSIKTVETQREGLKSAFLLTIPATDIESRVDQEVKRIAPQVQMPGFRPGKVPPNLIRKMHGDSIRHDALQGSVQDGVAQLLSEQGIRPAVRPEVTLANDYEPGKDAEVEVKVEALPRVTSIDVDKLKLERLTVEADESAVDAQVGQLAAQGKRWTDAPKKHAAVNGDLVVMDFVGSVGGTVFDGGSAEDMAIELGSGRLIPGFEEQLVGAKSGDDRTVEVTFPKDYANAALAGKDATFAVIVKAVRTGSEQKADDEFAKSMGLNDLAHLKQLVRDQLQQELNGLTRTHMKRQLLDELAARHVFEVPLSMVEAELQNIVAQLRQEASREADPAAAIKEIEGDMDEYRQIAERRVRLGLLLSEVGALNGIDVSEQETNQIVGQHAAQYQGEDRENFLRMVQQDPMFAAQLRAPLYEDKVVDHLFSTAEVAERSATRAQLEADLESEEGHVHGPDCGHDHAPAPKAAVKGAKKASKKPAKSEPQSVPAPVATKVAKPAATRAAAGTKESTKPAIASTPKPATAVKEGAVSKPAAKVASKAQAKPAKKAPPAAAKDSKKAK